ncbi:MAG TPA: endo-1,4-beta-xylanase [Tepidisphaeraceae bacterium]|nr:endo-1,4-beta-xylanase [Tepidisphaeraceae bacterium]
MSATGVSTVRLFPEWRSLEPAQGTWKWEHADALVKAAAQNQIELNAVLMGSTPWAGAKAHAFPMDHLDDWSTFVATVVGRYKDQIGYWEVWNEGNGGFNDDHHTTADYAKLAAATYAAAKRANTKAQVGLTVASFDPAYLTQAILAMAKEGKANSFDYLCIHPYEIADGLADPNGEIPYLWMTRLLRDMLKVSAPQRAGAEIWITEVGRRLENRPGRLVTEKEAATSLVKLYTMAIAQGIQRTHWFEAQDPAGEDQGFGLLSRDGTPRASYKAFKTLTTHLGTAPKYIGWLALGHGGRGYGFVLQGASTTVLAMWMPKGETEKALSFEQDVDLVDALSGAVSRVKAAHPIPLTDAPVFILGVPADLVATAQGNASKSFPWGGDYSKADAVSVTLGQPDGNKGVFQVGPQSTPQCTFPDGSTGIIVRGDQPIQFYVHPSFAGFHTQDYYVRLTVRRLTPGNLGMNFVYEVADSQGRNPYKNKGQWFSVPAGEGWQTHTWHVTDACFAKMWGYDLSFRPEQSVPFVIGKVEVSTKPF